MSLRLLQLVPSVPDDTARIARAAFPRGNPYVLLRDRLGPVFDDAGFADLYPQRGQPAYTPWRLALVTLLQFREGLSDRQAAEAVRARIDWKYLLSLDLADAGFDHTVLCEFRGRLLAGDAAERLLTRVLDTAREAGLLKARGRQRTDSTHVLAAVRDLNRVELVAETLRAALNAIAGVAPDWLRALAPPEWHARYDRRIEDMRLPETGPKREAYVAQAGADGYRLLQALEGANAPPDGAALPAVVVLRRVWARHFEREEAGPDNGETGGDGVRLRPVQGRGPGDRIESPYDTDARFRSKAGMSWTGYMVHLTETCDAGAPRLVVHADTTAANVHEAMRTARIHEALAAKGLAPSEHLVDSAYVSAEHLVGARERHGINLVGPSGPELAKPRRGRLQRGRLRCGLGPARSALPGGQGEHGLVRERQAPGPAELDPGPVPSRRLSRLRVPDPLHPGAFGPPRSRARPSSEARIRGPRCGPGPGAHGGRPAPLRATPRRGKPAVPRCAGLRPAPDALPRPG